MLFYQNDILPPVHLKKLIKIIASEKKLNTSEIRKEIPEIVFSGNYLLLFRFCVAIPSPHVNTF